METVAEQAALAVEHTAVSPAVTESKDYSVTLLDADGALVIGAGQVLYHYAAASHTVRSTIARHGDTIADGDVFIANDPHNGGGLHPQDVMIQRPIFADGERIGWVGVSAHMMDMGGMVVGSFAPNATECYQEALRVPAVRLFRRGEEVTEVWDIFRTNLRLSQLVEMDLRGLVAGCHFANERLAPIVEQVGVDAFARQPHRDPRPHRSGDAAPDRQHCRRHLSLDLVDRVRHTTSTRSRARSPSRATT